MNRRNFLKSFSAAIVGTVVASQLPATPVIANVLEAKEQIKFVSDIYEIHIDGFNILRFPRVQLLPRMQQLIRAGYRIEGNKIFPRY